MARRFIWKGEAFTAPVVADAYFRIDAGLVVAPGTLGAQGTFDLDKLLEQHRSWSAVEDAADLVIKTVVEALPVDAPRQRGRHTVRCRDQGGTFRIDRRWLFDMSTLVLVRQDWGMWFDFDEDHWQRRRRHVWQPNLRQVLDFDALRVEDGVGPEANIGDYVFFNTVVDLRKA